MAAVIMQYGLQWFHQVERNADDDWVKACQRLYVYGRRGRGTSKKTRRDCVAENMKVLDPNVCSVHDRVKWRTEIVWETV